MDNTFKNTEKLYRAVYPPSHPGMFWKKDGTVSPSAFADPKGLSVERGDDREDQEVVDGMKKKFTGCIVSVTAGDCFDTNALVKYLPSHDNKYHSEIHGSETKALLSKSQRYHLAERAKNVYKEA